MQYFGYQRRNRNDLSNPKFDGFDFWLDKLNQFGDYRRAETVKAFISALEYSNRFGPRGLFRATKPAVNRPATLQLDEKTRRLMRSRSTAPQSRRSSN